MLNEFYSTPYFLYFISIEFFIVFPTYRNISIKSLSFSNFLTHLPRWQSLTTTSATYCLQTTACPSCLFSSLACWHVVSFFKLPKTRFNPKAVADTLWRIFQSFQVGLRPSNDFSRQVFTRRYVKEHSGNPRGKIPLVDLHRSLRRRQTMVEFTKVYR